MKLYFFSHVFAPFPRLVLWVFTKCNFCILLNKKFKVTLVLAMREKQNSKTLCRSDEPQTNYKVNSRIQMEQK